MLEENYRTLLVKFDLGYNGTRKVHFTEHKTSTPSVEKPLGRTLYVTCVPPWMTAENLADFFSENGPVQNVFLEKKPNAGPAVYETEEMSRLLYELPDNRFPKISTTLCLLKFSTFILLNIGQSWTWF